MDIRTAAEMTERSGNESCVLIEDEKQEEERDRRATLSGAAPVST